MESLTNAWESTSTFMKQTTNYMTKLFTKLSKKFNTNDDTSYEQIVDPLTTFFYMGLLQFLPKGIKIGISDNQLFVTHPNVLQGPVRWTLGISRNNIAALWNPLQKIIEYYQCLQSSTECPVSSIMTLSQYTYFLRMASEGLRALQLSYQEEEESENLVSQLLSFYISVLTDKTISPSWNHSSPLPSSPLPSSPLPSSPSQINQFNEYYKELPIIWSKTEIELLQTFYHELQTSRSFEFNHIYKDSIQKILVKKNETFHTIIRNLFQ